MNIDFKKLYGIATVLLVIGVFGQGYGLFLSWNLINTGAKISSFANVGVAIIFVLIFYNMYKNTPSMKVESKEDETKRVDSLVNKYLNKKEKEELDKYIKNNKI